METREKRIEGRFWGNKKKEVSNFVFYTLLVIFVPLVFGSPSYLLGFIDETGTGSIAGLILAIWFLGVAILFVIALILVCIQEWLDSNWKQATKEIDKEIKKEKQK